MTNNQTTTPTTSTTTSTDRKVAARALNSNAGTTNRPRTPLPARTQHIVTLTVVGDQDLTVHSRYGPDEASYFSGRAVSVVLDGIIVYAHTHAALTHLVGAWRNACQQLRHLPPHAHADIQGRMLRPGDGRALATSAITFHDVMATGCQLVPLGRSRDGHPALFVRTGPLTVLARDRAAVVSIAQAWELAGRAAAELWGPPPSRTRHWERDARALTGADRD